MFKVSKQFFKFCWILLLPLHVPAGHAATTFEHSSDHACPPARPILREHEIKLVGCPHELEWDV